MRAFIAIPVAKAIREKLEKIQNELKKLPVNARWVDSKKLHITLNFFADINKDELEKIKKIIYDVTKKYPFFEISLTSFDFFPGKKAPRIFLVKLASDSVLENIAQDLKYNLKILNLPKEKKFKPHITLARIKTQDNISCLSEKINRINFKGQFRAEKIFLYRSYLSNQGPTYQEIFSSSLSS